MYGKDAQDLTAEEKGTISTIVGLAGSGIAASSGDVASTVQAGQVAQNAVENNFLSPKEYERKVELINKAQGGENSLNFKVLSFLNKGSLTEQEAREFLALVFIDQYSNQLLQQYQKNPNSLNSQQLYDLMYLLNQASEGDPNKVQQIFVNAQFVSADPYTGEQLNKTIIKAKQSLSYANSVDKQLAEAAEPALFGLSGKLGSVIRYAGGLAGSYNVGQGSAKIANGNYSEGAVQVVNGVLMVAPSALADGAQVLKMGNQIGENYYLNSKYLKTPTAGGVLNLGAGNKPIEGAYNISSPNYPMAPGVYSGDMM